MLVAQINNWIQGLWLSLLEYWNLLSLIGIVVSLKVKTYRAW
jgi:hypothetical protein